ncbi:hypothetical protein [Rhizobium sp. WYJ-E13]|uniref:hypothetical protein n=1 Tax=Rhizobium sp. WYJ-E13 TaxID=2849093 RepID=UPI001C1EB7F9|nr:hypothetical protein [Rhizobium sp. WYJ-E13]QWW68258.1 hypothetical protein KQ933_00685 [Rhizobium sp. WYJ-E13]
MSGLASSGNSNIEIPSVPSKNSWREMILAVQFWHTARLAWENAPREIMLNDPICHLLSHSMELSLKHFLRRNITSTQYDKLSRSHSLRILLARAIAEGLQIDAGEASCILAMEKAHRGFVFRYGLKDGETGYSSAKLDLCFPSTAHLIDRISNNPQVLRNGYGPLGLSHFQYPNAPAIRKLVDLAFLGELFNAFDKTG